MQILDHKLDQGYDPNLAMGLIVLKTDETIENEFRQIFGGSPSIALYHNRIMNAPVVNEETLMKMAQQMPLSAQLLPEREFKTIGYACTSGATVIGSEKVEQLIKSVIPKVSVTDPMRATLRALTALKIKKLAFISPYIEDVSEKMRQKIISKGFEIVYFASFNQDKDEIVARISPESIIQAIEKVAFSSECDAVFVSCTGLRVLPILKLAEEKIKKPVLSSNQVLAWDMLRLTKRDFDKSQYKKFGTLFSN